MTRDLRPCQLGIPVARGILDFAARRCEAPYQQSRGVGTGDLPCGVCHVENTLQCVAELIICGAQTGLLFYDKGVIVGLPGCSIDFGFLWGHLYGMAVLKQPL